MEGIRFTGSQASDERHQKDKGDKTNVADHQSPFILDSFATQVRCTPNASAVKHGAVSLSYFELDQKSHRLAHYLKSQGIAPNQLVGICAERSVDMLVGVLGILKARGAYVPLDPSYPADRLSYMLEDSAPTAVLTQAHLGSIFSGHSAEVILLDDNSQATASTPRQPFSVMVPDSQGQDLVYVIYTSGSTGRPKGTAMAHDAVGNLVRWQSSSFPAGGGRRVLQFAPLSFDVAFQEIFTTLCGGDILVLLDERVRRDPIALLSLLYTESIERLFVPPLVLQAIADVFDATNPVPLSLKDVIVAGERLRITPSIMAFFRSLPGCRLHNHYGPTETHVVTSLTLIGAPDAWAVLPSIGRPISGAQIYILDKGARRVPTGVDGEIYIGGVSVAQGYLGRPELTAQRFIADPFGVIPGARLYKTGDLARQHTQGDIEYLGRNDDQVKIRGFRIELGEIEAALATQAQVRDAVVLVSDKSPGERHLVGFVVLREKATTLGSDFTELLREHLRFTLPDYMIPAVFVTLDKIPLTPNGKADRPALLELEAEALANRPYEPPQGETEEILSSIWLDLLQVKRVGRADDFFQLGGHSLLIVQMIDRLRRVGLATEAADIYANPTLEDLARILTVVIDDASRVPETQIPSSSDSIAPHMLPLVELEQRHIDYIVSTVPGGARNIQDIYPLAPLQQGILFHHTMTKHKGDTYVLPMLLAMSSPERVEDFISALQRVVARHDVLRTAILWEGLPHPVQVVYRDVTVPVEQMILDPNNDAREQLRKRMLPERLGLDIRRAPLMHVQIASAGRSGGCYVLLQLHHIICDHDSVEAMFAEVMTILESRIHDLSVSVPYRDHVARSMANEHAQNAQEFFRKQLGDIDEPTILFGLTNVYGDGSRIEVGRQVLDTQLTERARLQSRRLGMSVAPLFHAAWALVVAHTSGRDDVVFGSLFSGRMQEAATGRSALGMFINTVPIRLRLAAVSALELVEQTQRELIELVGYEQASLSMAQRCSGVGSEIPLFNSLLNYLHSELNIDTEQVVVATGIQILETQERTNYPISLSVDDQSEKIVLIAQTDRRVQPDRVLEYMSAAIRSLIEALERAPHTQAVLLSILPTHERRRVLTLFNETANEYPREKLAHELFEEQVERTPDAVAVVHEGRSLTYAELNAKANQLAHHLRGRGVVADQLVGICVERSPEMVIGLLGILKAGGAYVPLDPNYPLERLAYMLDDAAPRVLLTQDRLRDGLPRTHAEVIALDERWGEIAQQPSSDLDADTLGLSAHNLAYVIYTSGSTGKPKGVMIEHRGLSNYLQWALSTYAPKIGDAVPVNSPLAFDATVTSLYCPLLKGCAVILLSSGQELEGLERLIQQPTQWSLVKISPAHLQVLGQRLHPLRLPHTVRAFVIGGEALSPSTVQLWRSIWPQVRLINEYGPTETVVGCCVYDIPQGWTTAPTVPIGCPIANTQIYILDNHRQPVPLGVTGEIYIGGAGVARGYLNRPELTAERFIKDPFSSDPGARLYKTGDLGRWRADGNIEYLGRNDHQVKIRGFRIELEEIEAALLRHEQVRETVVICEDSSGGKHLVAYVIPARGTDTDKAMSSDELKSHLRDLLPNYMVPSAFVFLPSFPLTSSGKLDRRSLPTPERSAYGPEEYEPPVGKMEAALAEIWKKLLQVTCVGRQDNFFELGGDSLSAMQLAGHIQSSLLVEMPVSLLFKFPTVTQLAAQLSYLAEAAVLDSVYENDVQSLLAEVESMPESRVQELLRELAAQGE